MAEIKHIGTPRHSGRYPWGSGEDGYQRNSSWLGYVRELRKQGLSDDEIAKGMGMNTSQFRNKRTIERLNERRGDVAFALRLKEKGLSNPEIGKRMGGRNESYVRNLLNPAIQERAEIVATVSDILKKRADEKTFVDVGEGVQQHLGISKTKLKASLEMLKEQGYELHQIEVKQMGTGKYTIMKVLTPPGFTDKEVFKNRYDIKMPDDYSEDKGRTFKKFNGPVENVSSDRILIRYGDEGGKDKDGVIEIRRGVEDLYMGNARYAQVRVGVDGTHFMKGMAMYSDDIPNGVDIIYNTKKKSGTPKGDVFKPMAKDEEGEVDQDNPFGASYRQKDYIDSTGKTRKSALNIVYEEGGEHSWSTWSKNLSSQVLSKQLPSLAKKQLDLSADLKKEEYDEIMALTNPTVKKILLKEFASECDSAAEHLKAAALPRQGTHVLLPIPSLKENEVYAPNFINGENVVLIRHPHGGPFEIPELIVNNKNQEANRLIKNAKDAVGINPAVAKRLSGADFDGDTVIVIPNKDRNIRTAAPLRGLENFDPIEAYPKRDGMKLLTESNKQKKMGEVSNLITDMTIKGASPDELARAVRHSMVVIDGVKHELDYTKSYIDNNIAGLREKYQGGAKAGAATLISRAKSKYYDYNRKDMDRITPETVNPETGEKIYQYTGKMYIKKTLNRRGPYTIDPVTGKKKYLEYKEKILPRLTKSTQMAEHKNAKELSSGTTMEGIYADYANFLKDLANKSRKAYLEAGTIPYSHSAKVVYDREVSSLKAKLNLALFNKPYERQAQLLANKVVSAKRRANPDMEKDSLKKLRGRALTEARDRVGAKKDKVIIEDREWDAIQAGAIPSTTLTQILLNADSKALKQRALPRSYKGMSPAKTNRAKAMFNLGYTQAEVANALGVSVDTLNKALE